MRTCLFENIIEPLNIKKTMLNSTLIPPPPLRNQMVAPWRNEYVNVIWTVPQLSHVKNILLVHHRSWQTNDHWKAIRTIAREKQQWKLAKRIIFPFVHASLIIRLTDITRNMAKTGLALTSQSINNTKLHATHQYSNQALYYITHIIANLFRIFHIKN